MENKNMENENNQIINKVTEKTHAIEAINEKISSVLSNIPLSLSRIDTVLDKPFKVIDEKAMAKINERSKEINEKMYNFSRGDSQTTRKLMTLQMLNTAGSTYRVLRDILANVERKEQVLTENTIKMKKSEVTINSTKNKIKTLNNKLNNANLLTEEEKNTIQSKIDLLNIKVAKETISAANGLSYVEAAIKELGFLQDCYEQIKKNKNIPDTWSEYDFEKDEIKSNIRNAFRLCIRDNMVNGRIGMGTIEYFEQFGISPMEAVYHTKIFLDKSNMEINKHVNNPEEHELPDYDFFHDFLDEMAEKYKDHYLKACRRMGLDDELISAEFILTNAANKLQLEK